MFLKNVKVNIMMHHVQQSSVLQKNYPEAVNQSFIMVSSNSIKMANER